MNGAVFSVKRSKESIWINMWSDVLQLTHTCPVLGFTRVCVHCVWSHLCVCSFGGVEVLCVCAVGVVVWGCVWKGRSKGSVGARGRGGGGGGAIKVDLVKRSHKACQR